MISADLISAVRSECGKVSNDEELEDTDIPREEGYILKRISARITDKRLRNFLSVEDQREYDVHADTIRVQKVFPIGSEELLTSLGTHHRGESLNDAEEYYLFPSLYVIELQRRIRGLPTVRSEWNHIRRKVAIDPAPTQSDNKYWYMSIESANWTLANLPEDFEELLVTGTAWKCLSIVILRRSNLGGIQRSGGMIDYPASSLKGFIDDKKDEFHKTLELKSFLYGAK